MIWKTERKSMKIYDCEPCRTKILPGDRYQELIASPDHEDLGNVGWWRMRVCWDCAWK